MVLEDSRAAPEIYRLVVLWMTDVVCLNRLHLPTPCWALPSLAAVL